MQLQDYRFSDYRLAAYVVITAVIAGGVAFGLDRMTAPATKVQANGAPPAAAAASGTVRQIPIARSSAADLGDPEGKLTPVYPAAPGKDLPVKDTPIVQAAKPVAATTGSASPVATAQAAAPAEPAPVAAAATPTANACNVAACAAAYRSFRESDCSYQPVVGERRYCAGAPGLGGQASAPVAAQPQMPQAQRAPIDPRSTAPVARSRYDDELRDAERMVRRLPPPGAFDGQDPRGVVVLEAPEQRYDIRRNWISEPLD